MKKYLSLTTEKYNSINLNHKYFITDILEKKSENIYTIKLTNNILSESFFKFSPLIDPSKYMIGKYKNKNIFDLPKKTKESTEQEIINKLYDKNNSSYVDGFFYYLSSQLFHNHNVSHGVDYYGSFLGIKINFVFI